MTRAPGLLKLEGTSISSLTILPAGCRVQRNDLADDVTVDADPHERISPERPRVPFERLNSARKASIPSGLAVWGALLDLGPSGHESADQVGLLGEALVPTHPLRLYFAFFSARMPNRSA